MAGEGETTEGRPDPGIGKKPTTSAENLGRGRHLGALTEQEAGAITGAPRLDPGIGKKPTTSAENLDQAASGNASAAPGYLETPAVNPGAVNSFVDSVQGRARHLGPDAPPPPGYLQTPGVNTGVVDSFVGSVQDQGRREPGIDKKPTSSAQNLQQKPPRK